MGTLVLLWAVFGLGFALGGLWVADQRARKGT